MVVIRRSKILLANGHHRDRKYLSRTAKCLIGNTSAIANGSVGNVNYHTANEGVGHAHDNDSSSHFRRQIYATRRHRSVFESMTLTVSSAAFLDIDRMTNQH
ncbi:hypothetical protein Salat_2613500 [Sesamum alatum]|uniref:Uncharacterized protein n=1 Tax=Sesamum alatum TaxID=300844 RepID=A0AAE1XP49_9LAMI|nr:hypothetical protein Salat_2613500 [Sesamum alatum]